MRRKLVIANWKMNPTTADEARHLCAHAKRATLRLPQVQTVICPPFPYLSLFKNKLTSHYKVGAQDVFPEARGAHTGEVCAPMLADAGVSHCIVGHSERRARGETDADVAQKIKSLLNEGITPVVCVGEWERDHAGQYLSVLDAQIRQTLAGLSRQRSPRLVLAYEPVWAIGKTAADAMTAHTLHQTILFIRKVLTKLYGRKTGMALPIVYGGSAEPDNVRDLLRGSGIAGFLVGHASIDAREFAALLHAVAGS